VEEMIIKHISQVLCFILLMTFPAYGHNHPHLENAKLIGTGILKIYWAKVYTISHYQIPAPGPYQDAIVLSYEYLRDVPKDATIEASIEEFERYANITEDKTSRWTKYLEAALTDMADGDRAEIWQMTDGSITFYSPDQPPVRFDDAEFAEVFMNIWLGSETNYPDLRLQLLGQ
jgi:hypothetical protein